MYVRLSHDLAPDTPSAKHAPPIVIYPHRQVARGDLYNTHRVELWNHQGTHIDGPRHVSDDARPLADFPIETFLFSNPLLIDIPCGQNETIDVRRIDEAVGSAADCDLLLIRTGFESMRASNPTVYIASNPGLSRVAAAWLLDRFPRMRALGFDTPAPGPLEDFQACAETHRVLMNPRLPRPDRFILEDMKLSAVTASLRSVWAVPIFVTDIDSAWCTVIGQVVGTTVPDTTEPSG